MAALTTLAGNLLVVRSLANIIAVEYAKEAGVTLSFLEHARCAIPIAGISLALAVAWFVGGAFVRA
jgi:Na+/H+ antiporter NhaD/arsenite permease-like protein